MSTEAVTVAAIDLGASSGRVMVGAVGPDRLALRSVARFANDPVRLPDGLHWNVVELYRQSLLGLRAAVASAGPDGIASVAVDSWAVDYALLRGGTMLGVPFHYRDDRSGRGVETVHSRVDRGALYDRNGLQFLPFNTIYQLAADPLTASADHALLIPDLIGHWLSGGLHTELTNASTTGLIDRRTRSWDKDLLAWLMIPPALFPELVEPGVDLGPLLPDVAALIGSTGTRLVSVGSHDTASAVVGVPMQGDDAAYISCGTWGLVGVELSSPVVSPHSRAANFTNEAGVDGTTRFLTNVMGTWIISETMRTWERTGGGESLDSLLEQAADISGPVSVFDVQDASFVPPGDMPARIAAYFDEAGVAAPVGRPALIRSIVESLAVGFATAVDEAQRLSGRLVRQVHVVGGGSQNRLLCQAIADRTGRVVVAGPVEATALGNVLVQARALGAISGGLDALRSLVAQSQALARYHPRSRASQR